MRVLLAEDDAQIGEGVVHGLRKAGFAVDWVRNGSEADTALNGDGFDVLVLDAFSSDAIPVHLITLEAVGLYLRKLAPHGLMAVHISNRYLDLAPVVGATARAAGAGAGDELR